MYVKLEETYCRKKSLNLSKLTILSGMDLNFLMEIAEKWPKTQQIIKKFFFRNFYFQSFNTNKMRIKQKQTKFHLNVCYEAAKN